MGENMEEKVEQKIYPVPSAPFLPEEEGAVCAVVKDDAVLSLSTQIGKCTVTAKFDPSKYEKKGAIPRSVLRIESDEETEGACALPSDDEHDTEKPRCSRSFEVPQVSEDEDNDEETDAQTPAKKLEAKLGKQLKPMYKLIYFNARAMAEPLRLLLAYGRIIYEDVRITREEWYDLKSSIPMGHVPVLLYGDRCLYHLVPMARYLSNVVGLAGNSVMENTEIDMAVETINDLRQKILVAHYDLDDRHKKRKVKTLNTDIIPSYMLILEKTLMENYGFFALKRLTWADVFFAGIIDYLSFVVGYDMMEKYPGLKNHVNMINNIKQIKSWIASRPETEA